MTIDFVALAGAVSVLLVLTGGFMKLYTPLKKQLDRLEKLEQFAAKQQRDNEFFRESNIVIMGGVLASLEGMKEQGFNGPINQGIANMRKYMIEQAHRAD